MTGKEKCELLKRIREDIARKNGIEGYEFKPCPNADTCVDGTCPACDAEVASLKEKLKAQGKEDALKDLNDLKNIFPKEPILSGYIIDGKIKQPEKPKRRRRGDRLSGKIKASAIKNIEADQVETTSKYGNCVKKDDDDKKPRGILGKFKKKK